jgi:energy-coupling factor transporter ATP-binding protein EcfA2
LGVWARARKDGRVKSAALRSSGWGSVADRSGDPERPVVKATLLDAMIDLRRDVEAAGFPLPLPGAVAARERRAELLAQLDDHLLPRLRELSAPALVVVAGSTGAGKSTLVNSLLQAEISRASVLRPTTRRPVLALHPDDADLLIDHPLLTDVERVSQEAVPRGVALLDAPDLDSLVDENRAAAHRLLESADLWLFVTTAARYGDALPWAALDEAARRGVSMAMVLNRVPSGAVSEVRRDLLARLTAHGLTKVPLFLVRDVGPHEGMLPTKAVAPVYRWLTVISGADRAQGVIARTQRGSLAAVRPWVGELVDAVEEQVAAREKLERRLDEALSALADSAAAEVTSGAVATGPVRGAWLARSGVLSKRPGRRTRTAYLRAVEEFTAELTGSARVALAAARRSGERLVDRETGTDLDALDLSGMAPPPEPEADAWLAETRGRLAQGSSGSPSRGVGRLVRNLTDEGAAVLVAAAAIGLGAARVVVEQIAGADSGRYLIDASAGDLAARMRAQVLAAAVPIRSALDIDALDQSTATRLSLRRAAIKEWT